VALNAFVLERNASNCQNGPLARNHKKQVDTYKPPTEINEYDL
jgi:hypothetical protein